MNLSELLEVYGNKDSKTETSTTSSSASGFKPNKKTNSNRKGRSNQRGGPKGTPIYHAMANPQMPHPMPPYMPFDPSYPHQYAQNMPYYGPVMMYIPTPQTLGSAPNQTDSANAPKASVPNSSSDSTSQPQTENNSAQDKTAENTSTENNSTENTSTEPSAATAAVSDKSINKPTSSTSNTTFSYLPSPNFQPYIPQYMPADQTPFHYPLPYGPNFAAPYPTPYLYSHDASFSHHYANPPPQKRAKRAPGSKPHRAPLSPCSDSAESSSSNSTHSEKNSSQEKQQKQKKLSCEPCEKSFKTQQQYEAHLAMHIKCPYDGCEYSAVRASLKLHELLHVNNMFAKLQTPEEIEKYRQERKRRFPSIAAAAEREKERNNAKLKANAKQTESESAVDSDAPQEVSSKSSAQDSAKGGAIDHVDTENGSTGGRIKRKRNVCKYWKQGNCNKGEQCVYSHAELEPRKRAKKDEDSTSQGHRSAVPKDSKQSKTLLGKFLQTEIQKENKAILQCLQYIMDNNFFKKM